MAGFGRQPPEHGDLKAELPRQAGDAPGQPELLHGQIDNDDFSGERGLGLDVRIGTKKLAQRARQWLRQSVRV